MLDDCILDVGSTGDASYAASAVSAASAAAAAPVTLGPGTPAAIGQQVSGQIAAGGRDAWSFTASAGQIVYIDASGPCLDGLSWQLDDPDGNLQDFEAACQDLGRSELPGGELDHRHRVRRHRGRSVCVRDPPCGPADGQDDRTSAMR